MKRIIKQITIISIFFGFIGLIIFGIFYLNKEEQPEPIKETGPEKKEIIIKQGDLIENQNKFDYITYLENPNTEWAIKKIKYDLKQNNKIIKSGNFYLAPEETASLIIKNLNIENKDKIPEIELSNYKWERKKTNLGKTNLEIKNIKLTESNTISGNKVIVQAEIYNKTSYNLKEVNVYIINELNNELLAINSSSVYDLEKNKGRKFQVEWRNLDTTDLSEDNFEIKARTNFYDSTNFVDIKDSSNNKSNTTR